MDDFDATSLRPGAQDPLRRLVAAYIDAEQVFDVVVADMHLTRQECEAVLNSVWRPKVSGRAQCNMIYNSSRCMPDTFTLNSVWDPKVREGTLYTSLSYSV